MTEIVVFVLDTTCGKPATGIPVTLQERVDADDWRALAHGRTDESGCIPGFVSGRGKLSAGRYRLLYDTSNYFAAQDRPSMFDEIVVDFVLACDERYVLPLLLSPFGYTTYRGS